MTKIIKLSDKFKASLNFSSESISKGASVM